METGVALTGIRGKKCGKNNGTARAQSYAAEGMLYIYDEKNGNVGLLKANPEKFDLVSSFKVSPWQFRAILVTSCNS